MPTNNAYIDSLNDKHTAIIDNLQELQAVEQYLFQQIQDAAASNAEQSEEKSLKKYIDSLITQRSRVLNELGNLYSKANENVDANSTLMGSQATMSAQLKKEMDKAKLEEKRLIAEKNNKQRLAQIGEYEYSKNNEHRSVLKTIVYGSFFVLVFIYLNSIDILPTFLTKIFVTIITFVTLYLIIVRMIWNYRRNNIDYGKFNFPKKEGKETEDAKYENDLTLGKLLGLECKQTDITEDVTSAEEGFSLLNKNGCKCSKNVLPLNLFKNNSLKYSTVN